MVSLTKLRRHLRARSDSQSGVTLMELLIVIGITGMVLVPVMAWSITAINRDSNADIDGDTAAFAALAGTLTSDVARSITGVNPVPAGAACGDDGLPAVLRLDYNWDATKTITFHERDTGKVDPGTGKHIYELIRRSCTGVNSEADLTEEAALAENLGGPVIVKCEPRKKYAFTPDGDGCGEVSMKLEGIDGSPVTLRATRQVDPKPNPQPGSRPTAVIACSPACPVVGFRALKIDFDGTLSSDRDPGGVTGWAWDFGDGSPVVPGGRISHTFERVGTFTVTLSVSNASGGTKTETTTVEVKNAPPIAIANPNPVSTFRNEPVNFNGTASYDPDHDFGGYLSWLWNFDTGASPPATSDQPNVFHTYVGVLGRVNASLTVKDNDPDDAQETSIDIPVDVANNPPKFDLGANFPTGPCNPADPASGTCIQVNDFPITVDFKATNPATGALGANDLDGQVLSGGYKWDIHRKGDPISFVDPLTLGTSPKMSFRFNQNGVYTVTLDVTDDDFGHFVRSIDVVVNQKPTAVATPNKCVINVGEPATCQFDGSESNDADGEIVAVSWDWGDGTVEDFPVTTEDRTGLVRSHTWNPRPAFGTFNVRMTVTDDDGSSTSAILPVKVNVPPVAKILPDQLIAYRMKDFPFSAMGSTDPDGDLTNWEGLTFSWNFGDGTSGVGHTPSHKYMSVGFKTVTLTAVDADGGIHTVTRQIQVVNQPPEAHINIASPFVNDPGPHRLVGSANPNSVDIDGSIVNYAWDFGDGTTQSGTNPNFDHTYADYGSYQLKLTVTDNDGATATDSVWIIVNKAPVANFTTTPNPPIANDPPLLVKFDASSSYDPDGEVEDLTYAWDFGDGTTGTGVKPSHTYTQREKFTVTLTVTDLHNGTSTKTVVGMVGINKLPIAKINNIPGGPPYGADKGQNVKPATWSFNPAASSDPDGTIVSYRWDFGDGTPAVTGTGAPLTTISHEFTNYGTFTVRLTVTDDMGSQGFAEVVVKVNQRPVAVIGPNPDQDTIYAGNGIELSLTGLESNDPDGTITAWRWDFGDGGNSTDSRPKHTYTANGEYTISLVVQDNNVPAYFSVAATKKVIVQNSPPVAKIVSNPPALLGKILTSAPGPLNVQFDGSTSLDPDAPPGSQLTYLWDFGDGSPTSSASVVNHQFSNGTFTVSLTVTDVSGLSDTATVTVRVNIPPVALITIVGNDPPCGAAPPCTVTFDGGTSYDPDGTIVGNIGWEVAGSRVKTVPWANGDRRLTYTFNNVGDTNVTLIIADNDGRETRATYRLHINTPPVASFTTNPNPPVVSTQPYTISFNATPSSDDGTIQSYSWNFGDGSAPATGLTTSHTFTQVGSYQVTLTVTDNWGISSSVTRTIRVNQPPIAKIGPATLDPKLNLNFTFDGSGSSDPDGAIASYLWNFGDGTPVSTLQSPVHVYTANGPYTVTLTVTDNDGVSNTTSRTLTVAPNVTPTAEFVTDPASGRGDGTPALIRFDGSPSVDPDGQIVTYTWNFGDGSTGTGKNPSHTYTQYGTFTVTLIVTDNNGATATVAHDVLINMVPIPSIITTPDPPIFNSDPHDVTFFADFSQDPDGTIVSYHWDFGDGEVGNGTPVSHTFGGYGTYTVTLTLTDNSGGQATETVDVKVNRPPVASATYSPSDVVRMMDVNFQAIGSNDSDGSIVLYRWNFGDGFIGSGYNATHQYTAMGDYTVTLTVIDNDGGQGEYSFPISVGNASPEAKILTVPSPPVVDVDEPVQFYGDRSSDPDGTVATYLWDFGDGTTSTLANPTHSYDAYGDYPVMLTVTDNDGGAGVSEVLFVTVNQSPVAVIGPTTGITRGIEFQFSSAGSYDPDGTIEQYEWHFGDGTTSTEANPKHTYGAEFGLEYTVDLYVWDNDGTRGEAHKTITLINQAPVAVASAQRVLGGSLVGAPSGPAPLEIEFNADGSYDPDGTITWYSWDFGDGATSAKSHDLTVRHTYTGSFTGTRTATLTVEDNNGRTSTKTVTVTIKPNTAPVASFSSNPPISAGGPLTVSFDASASYDPDGEIVSYKWDFDTGLTQPDNSDLGEGRITQHYFESGFWTIRLTVTDNSGATTSTTRTFQVAGKPAAPTGLQKMDENGNFKWTPVPGATGYHLYARSSGGCANSDLNISGQASSGHLNSYADHDVFGCAGPPLNSGVVYHVFVEAEINGVWSDPAGPLNWAG